jgi:hypothetical protein
MNPTYWNSFSEAFRIHDYICDKRVGMQEATGVIAPKHD